MADYLSARAKIIAACDELDLWQGQPTLSSQLSQISGLQAQVATLQGQVTQVTLERDAAIAQRDAAQSLASSRRTAMDSAIQTLQTAP